MDEVGSSSSSSKEVGDKPLEVPWRPRHLVFGPYVPSSGGAFAKTHSLRVSVRRPVSYFALQFISVRNANVLCN